MNSWSKTPFVRIIIPFIAGILIYRSGWCSNYHVLIMSSTLALIVALAAWLFVFKPLNKYKLNIFQGIAIIYCLISIGWLVSYHHDYRNRNNFIGNFSDNQEAELILKLDNSVEQKSNNMKTTASAMAIKKDNSWVRCSGRILLYIANEATEPSLSYGDIIVAKCRLNEIQNQLFNSDFNYKRYLADKNIFHQAYIQDYNYEILKKQQGNAIMTFALSVRNKMNSILQEQLGSNDESGVVSAMLTGYRADISADMMNAYSKAGVIHIMSVSGLHVGVIYIMITAVVGLFGWFKKRKWLNIVIVVTLIWFYAFITGLSASVLRSATMISFVVIGTGIQRSISPFNSLAAAAFILLAFNPGSIGEIGFQLSFMAVLGILLFQKPLYNLWTVRNKWIDKIWQLACVSMAAQIITLPFILYYFGQFPVYFILSNLIVVPLSSLVLYAGMASVLLYWIPLLSTAISFVTIWLTKTMNFVVTTIESLPGAVISNIYISAWPAVFVFAILIFGYLMFYHKKIKFIYLLLILGILATLFEWNHKAGFNKQQNAYFLKDGNEYIIGIKQEKNLYLINTGDSSDISDYLQIRLNRFASRNNLEIIEADTMFNDNVIFRHNGFIGWNKFSMLAWKERKMPRSSDKLPKTDLMLAPLLSKYYYENHKEHLPVKVVLARIKTNKPNCINISGKKEWVFEN